MHKHYDHRRGTWGKDHPVDQENESINMKKMVPASINGKLFKKITSNLILFLLENHIATDLLLDDIYDHLALLILRSFPFWSYQQAITEFKKYTIYI